MMKACSWCGRIHPQEKTCPKKPTYREGKEKTEEQKLRSKSKWKHKSVDIRNKAKYLCEVCFDEGKLTYKNLEVHHIDKLSENPNGLLDNYNVICLCQHHHKNADKGLIPKAYLKELARKREERIIDE